MLCALFSVLACIIIVVGIRVATSKDTKHKKSVETSAKSGKAKIDTSDVEVKKLVIDTEEVKDKKASVMLTVSSIGDCTLGTDVNFNQDTSLNAYYNAQGADYFFQNVRSILSEDDLTIVNMEGTLTDSDQRENKTYAFKAPPEYASILSGSSVEAANLANNHSHDYGAQSYTDTIAALEGAGVSIDEGADLVIGHHPHVLQGVEKYKDKYIAYSLGNFCFGGNSNPEDKDTMIFQQTFTFKKGVVQKNDDIQMIPCSLSSATGYNDYCPTPLEGDSKQRVLDKIEEYSKDL